MVATKRGSVTTSMIQEAVAALSERNGSSAKSIFNYLVKTNRVRATSRAEVSLFIGRAVKAGSLAMKLPNTFVIPTRKLSSKKAGPSKGRKRKTRRVKRKSAKKMAKRRRRRSAGKKRKQLKKKRSTKKRARVVRKKTQKKSQKKRRVRRKIHGVPAKARVAKPVAVPARRTTGRPVRKATLGIVYTA